MRNWNPLICCAVSAKCAFLAYLWGIETSKFHLAFFHLLFVFSLPMRNWNSATLVSIRKRLPVFSLPMRNWNSYLAPGKQPYCDSFLAYLWGIETGYWATHTSVFAHVFSLPMRNWNPRARVPLGQVVRVFSLPMRNWNHYKPSWLGQENSCF